MRKQESFLMSFFDSWDRMMACFAHLCPIFLSWGNGEVEKPLKCKLLPFFPLIFPPFLSPMHNFLLRFSVELICHVPDFNPRAKFNLENVSCVT